MPTAYDRWRRKAGKQMNGSVGFPRGHKCASGTCTGETDMQYEAIDRLRQQRGRHMTADISQVVIHPWRRTAASRTCYSRKATPHPLHPQPSMMSRVLVHQLAKLIPVERTPLNGRSSTTLMAGGERGGTQQAVHRYTCLPQCLRIICRH